MLVWWVVVLLVIVAYLIGRLTLVDHFKSKYLKVYHEHDYKWSKDYHRLWELLDEGRRVIRLQEYNDHEGYPVLSPDAVVMEKSYDSYNGKSTYLGMGLNSNLDDASEEQFVAYCVYKGIKFLDYLDVKNDLAR